jgi:hypothetical protein
MDSHRADQRALGQKGELRLTLLVVAADGQDTAGHHRGQAATGRDGAAQLLHHDDELEDAVALTAEPLR